jgi:hypothetical protein
LPAFAATPPVRVAEITAMATEYDWHRHPNQPIFYPQQASFPVTD